MSFEIDWQLHLFGGELAEPGREAAFLVLAAFLLSFGFIRTSARLTRSVSWWPGGVETEGGVHLHHLVWGITLLLVSGFLAFAFDLVSPWWQITAAGFGIGAGFTLDEFALWVRLQDVYWSEQGRASLDAVVMAAVFAGLMVLGFAPFGLGQGRGVAAVLYAVLTVGLAAVTFLKGRLWLGVVALFVPLAGILTACLLAGPDSPWAHRFYRGRRAPKLERARHRYARERPLRRLRRRLLDAIGGAPSDRQAPRS